MSKIRFQTYEPAMWTRTQDILLESIPHPVPAAKMVPEYFKKIVPYTKEEHGYNTGGTVKKCPPFIDAMTSGYIIPLWFDAEFLVSKDNILLRSKLDPGLLVGFHPEEQIPNHPYVEKYPFSRIALKYFSPWLITTPPGWSCLFTSPFNHLETRFKVLDAIVDTDSYYAPVNFPFVWTGYKEGPHLIKKGTPIVQVIPFKREDKLDLEVSTMSDEEVKKALICGADFITTNKNHYRDNDWHKRKR